MDCSLPGSSVHGIFQARVLEWGAIVFSEIRLCCCCCCCYVAWVVSDSVRSRRRQPTSLSHPWDSPGKNTGVGCHFLLQCMKVKSQSEVAQSCLTLSDPMDCSLPGSFVHGIFQSRVLEWVAISFSRNKTLLVIKVHYPWTWASLVTQTIKNLPAIRKTWVWSLGRSPGGGHGNPLQYFCLENPYGQRSLVGYSPWGHKELDTTERISTRTQNFYVLFLRDDYGFSEAFLFTPE